MKPPRLPSRASETWPSNALTPPTYTFSVAAAGGAVFAGGEELRVLEPGATQFGKSPTPPNVGDVVAVAVDPHCRGRMAAVGLFSVAVFEGSNVHVHDFPEKEFEFEDLAWGPATSDAGRERQATLAGDTAEARRPRRDQLTRPLLAKLRAWLDQTRGDVRPKTPLGRALGYLHRQGSRLVLLLDDGNIEATNIRRERELRRLILGRKNWLFTWLDEGATRSSHILSLVATCIAHDVNPRGYLHLVTRLIVRGWPQSKLRDLLPDRMLEVALANQIG